MFSERRTIGVIADTNIACAPRERQASALRHKLDKQRKVQLGHKQSFNIQISTRKRTVNNRMWLSEGDYSMGAPRNRPTSIGDTMFPLFPQLVRM